MVFVGSINYVNIVYFNEHLGVVCDNIFLTWFDSVQVRKFRIYLTVN